MPDPMEALKALRIRVLLVKLGDMDGAKFESYSNIIKQSYRISLAELTPILSSGSIKSVFLKQIGSPGSIMFDFVSDENVQDMHDFKEFQLHHRIFAAIGLGGYKTRVADHESFLARQKLLQHCLISRHFSFEPDDKVEDNYTDIVVIPNQDMDQISFYLQTMMSDFAISLLRRFDIIAQEIGSMPEIPSPRGYDGTLSKDAQNRIHLRYAGRRLKLMGDLYLLAGAFPEAVNSFVGASEETKVIHDHLWHAAAQEGLQISLCLQSVGSSDEAIRKDLWTSLPQRLKEVAVLYDKSVMPRLSFQTQSQISYIYTMLEDKGEAASALSQGWNACRPLVVYEKLVVLSMIIERFLEMRLYKKANFYRKRLIFHLNNLGEKYVAGRLMESVVQSLEWVSWPTLKRAILDQAMDLAEAALNYKQCLLYAFDQLCSSMDLLTTTEQERLKSKIKSSAQKLRSFDPLPVACEVIPVSIAPRPTQGIRVDQQRKDNGRTSPSVFMPSRAHLMKSEVAEEKFLAIVGEPLQIRLTLSNPFSLRLTLKAIRLVTDMAEVEVTGCTLEPLEKDRSFLINFIPLQEGERQLETVQFHLFNAIHVSVKVKPVRLRVYAAQPLLKVLKVPEHLQLLEGEIVELDLSLMNLNEVDATIINVMGDESVKQLDPVQALIGRSSKSFTVELVGVLFQPKVQITFEYSGQGHIWRILTLTIPLTVIPSLSILAVTFLPCSIGSATAKFTPPLGVLLSGHSYDNLQTVMELENAPINGAEWCYAAFDIHNESSISFDINCADSAPLKISPAIKKRLVMPFKKISVSADIGQLSDEQLVSLRSPHSNTIDSVAVEDLLLKEELCKQIQFSWNTFDSRSGLLDCPKPLIYSLPSGTLAMVKMPPALVSLQIAQWDDEQPSEWTPVSGYFARVSWKENYAFAWKVERQKALVDCKFLVDVSVPGLDDFWDVVLLDGRLECPLGDVSEARLEFRLFPRLSTVVQLRCFAQDRTSGAKTPLGPSYTIRFA